MQFEAIVRPFQSPEVGQPRRAVAVQQSTVERVLLAFGRSGSGKVMSGTYSYQKSFYCDQQIVEKDDLGISTGELVGGGELVPPMP